jgi:hypothetical protein
MDREPLVHRDDGGVGQQKIAAHGVRIAATSAAKSYDRRNRRSGVILLC